MKLIRRMLLLTLGFNLLFLDVPTQAGYYESYKATVTNHPTNAAELLDFWNDTLQRFYDVYDNKFYWNSFHHLEAKFCSAFIKTVFRSDYTDPYEVASKYNIDCLSFFLQKVFFLKHHLSRPDFKTLSEQALAEFQVFWENRHHQLLTELIASDSDESDGKHYLELFKKRYSTYFEIWKSVLLTSTPLIPDTRPLSESPILTVLLEENRDSKSLHRHLQDLKGNHKQAPGLRMKKLIHLWTHLPHARIAQEHDSTQFLFDHEGEVYSLGVYSEQDSLRASKDIQEALKPLLPLDPLEPQTLLASQTPYLEKKVKLEPINSRVFKEALSLSHSTHSSQCPEFSLLYNEHSSPTYLQFKIQWEKLGIIDTIGQQDCFRLKLHDQTFELGCYEPKNSSLTQIRNDLAQAGLNYKAFRKLEKAASGT